MAVSPLVVTLLLVILAAILVAVIVSVPVFIRITLQVLDTTIGGSLSVTWGGAGLRLVHGDTGRTLSVIIARRECILLPLTVFTARAGDWQRATPGMPEKTFVTRILQQAPDVLRLMNRMIRDINLNCCSGTFRIGLGSAADTGRLFGHYAAIRPVLMASRRFSFSFVPVFDRRVLEGNIEIDLLFSRPLVHIIRFIRFLRLLDNRHGNEQLTGSGVMAWHR